ncbi:hypothetical protein [Nocardioides yefusunii]|uniref:hypothetical protein n=1 Tax=Nocardioides yefusunii TaxID=2500546 RepID=UPI003BAC8892
MAPRRPDRSTHSSRPRCRACCAPSPEVPDPDGTGASLHDADVQTALWICHQFQVAGVEGVDDAHEYSPVVLELRRRLEARFEADLRALAAPVLPGTVGAVGDGPVEVVRELVAAASRPDQARRVSLTPHLRSTADRDEYLDFLMHRSIYHLQESDPHNFVLARVAGPAKVALPRRAVARPWSEVMAGARRRTGTGGPPGGGRVPLPAILVAPVVRRHPQGALGAPAPGGLTSSSRRGTPNGPRQLRCPGPFGVTLR